jgi:predicted unusual protein kinase regulating ubiquinone biosynthesis (AarF/ABC1/UbiB family)
MLPPLLPLLVCAVVHPSIRLVSRTGRIGHASVEMAVLGHEPSTLPATSERWESALEPVLLDRSLSFSEKCKQLESHFSRRPVAVAQRIAQLSASATKVAAVWAWEGRTMDTEPAQQRLDVLAAGDSVARDSKRGAVLRAEISKQGVLAVKLAQTLATRPDLIGDEAAAALAVLQDSNVPFGDEEAFAIVAEDLGCEGPLAAHWVDDPADICHAASPGGQADDDAGRLVGASPTADEPAAHGRPLFHSLTRQPVAAASLAQVYKARTWEGLEVALKVRRPRLAAQVALDVHVLRRALRLLEEYWGSGTDIVGISDEVCRGVFSELDLRSEAENARTFAAAHLHLPYVTVPRHAPSLSARRVLATEWIDGVKLPDLELGERRKMIRAGLDACFAQLLGTGVVHADPHYGNMLWTNDGRLALLDFGLMTTVRPAQREAMANAILSILTGDWAALLSAYREMGVVPEVPCVWVDVATGERISGLLPGKWAPCSDDEYFGEFVKAMERRGGEGGAPRSFSQLTADLSELALEYKFYLPPWMVYLVRAVITLDGFAARACAPAADGCTVARAEEAVNAVEAAMPHAVRRVFCPTTAEGRSALERAILDEDGEIRWARLLELADATGAPSTPADGGDSAASAAAEDAQRGGTSSPAADGDVSAVTAPLLALLAHPEGAALRRLIHTLDAASVLRRITAIAATSVRHGTSHCASSAALRSALASSAAGAFRSIKLPSQRAGAAHEAQREPVGATPLADSPSRRLLFSAYPTAKPDGSERAARRVHRFLLRAHLARLLSSPRGVLDVLALVAALAAFGARCVASEASQWLRHRLTRWGAWGRQTAEAV